MRAILFLLFCCSACQEPSGVACPAIEAGSEDTLRGELRIGSQGQLILEHSRKVQLFPCDESLREYIESAYDAFLYLHRKDEKMEIRVDGQYWGDVDTLEGMDSFWVNFVAL